MIEKDYYKESIKVLTALLQVFSVFVVGVTSAIYAILNEKSFLIDEQYLYNCVPHIY
jgi:DNA-binding XRE family transcriptional regulator